MYCVGGARLVYCVLKKTILMQCTCVLCCVEICNLKLLYWANSHILAIGSLYCTYLVFWYFVLYIF